MRMFHPGDCELGDYEVDAFEKKMRTMGEVTYNPKYGSENIRHLKVIILILKLNYLFN